MLSTGPLLPSTGAFILYTGAFAPSVDVLEPSDERLNPVGIPAAGQVTGTTGQVIATAVCGLTGHFYPVFILPKWQLESRHNSQARKPAPRQFC